MANGQTFLNQARSLSPTQLNEVQRSLGIRNRDIRTAVAKTQTKLYELNSQFDSQQKALRAELERFNLDATASAQKNRLDIESLTDTFESETQERELRFGKNLDDFKLQVRRENLALKNQISGLRESQELKDLSTDKNLALTDLERAKLLAGDKTEAELFGLKQQGLSDDLGYFGALGKSFGVTQGLLDDRLALIGEVEGLQTQQNLNTQSIQRENLRGAVFSSQNLLAREKAVQGVFGSGLGDFFGSAELVEREAQVGRQIHGLTKQLKNTKIQKELIAKQATDRRLGVNLQKEGVRRQQLRVKNSVKKTKLAMKQNNVLRNKQKKDVSFALKGLDIGEKFLKDTKRITGIQTERRVQTAKAGHSLALRQINLNKDFEESLNTLRTVSGQQEFGNKLAQMQITYANSKRQAIRKHREDVRKQQADMYQTRYNRQEAYQTERNLIELQKKKQQTEEEEQVTTNFNPDSISEVSGPVGTFGIGDNAPNVPGSAGTEDN